MNRTRGITRIEVLIIVAIVGILVVAMAQPYFEAKAFNKFSETKVTYWDALWTQLRIEPTKP